MNTEQPDKQITGYKVQCPLCGDIIDSETKDVPYTLPLTDEKTDAFLVWAHLAAGGSPDEVVIR